ncbi:hypothetical protein [Sphingomonas qomolangmaensis]|uniref:Uncharacterized protein n=1 Tax=Sphingomonas qomolangmaensis TaxID=2918765 RepID=A0ABY5L775_9SPHN|nr:hypothetical protein [Sphingomonas qomolangmaensis]UUL82647.1 hypothetical protein NMP03_16000 [Sphingomonas qomolangmaensis]
MTVSTSRRFCGAAAIVMALAAGSLRPLGAARAQGVATPAAAYPAKPVLDAFRATCSNLRDLTGTERRATATGWTKLADSAATPLAGLMRFSETAAADFVKKGGGTMRPSSMFKREIAGELVYLVLSGVTLEGRTVNGCRLYDADEPRRIAPATVTAWIGREPVQSVDQPALARTTWEPGMAKGQDSFELSFIATASPMLGVPQVAGIALKADQLIDA